MTLRHWIPTALVPRTLRSGGRLRMLYNVTSRMLFRYGWYRSLREGRCVNAAGDPVPWFSYPAIDFLSQFDYSEKTVFEYGAGYSTLFWSQRVKSIVAVESDVEWVKLLRPKVGPNVEFIQPTEEAEEYAGTIDRYGKFDVIVIDGIGPARPLAASRVLPHLNEDGMVILDNADLWLKSAAILREAGLIQCDFTGFAPLSDVAQTTSVFLTRQFQFRPLGGYQPHKSVAQPAEAWPNA